jgi:tripartite-type tricarboxylate transporter receptor subunit TctC
MKIMRLLVVAALFCVVMPATAAEKYPSKPIYLLTPFSAGGGSDILARLIAPEVSKALGQNVIVENHPGAGGKLGAGIAVNSAPDGYTFILVSGSYGANAALYKLPYDSVTDISPVILVGTTCLVMEVHPSVPLHSVKQFIAYAKKYPNKLNVGSAGLGGVDNFASELFKLETGVKFTLVPYKGSGPVMTGLLTGEIDASYSSQVPSMPHIKAGKLRPLGVTTPKRSRVLPDVPSIGETVPGYDVTHWYGIWGPKNIPQDIVLRWNHEVAKALRTPAIRDFLLKQGLEPAGGPPEEFRDRITKDVAKWKRVVREAHIPMLN